MLQNDRRSQLTTHDKTTKQNIMKKRLLWANALLGVTLCLTTTLTSCQPGHDPSTKEDPVLADDPLATHIYTLKNGLKVYLTVNHDEPRIQTYVAVRTGSRNDPAESTGLAHYLEHLMFKGTTRFGTLDYAKEKPLLDSIEAQYEIYGRTTDDDTRRAIYARIDSFSHEASKYAIANEYDKMMTGIGSTGSNAYTSTDVTCYQENIPCHALEPWARVQAERFRNMVIRGFHTELEAVYEEYNMHLTNDFDKVNNALYAILFPHHPYGTQTTIGTQEHLKNPSLRNVMQYYHEWYVPNNVAICMSGDLDPDATVRVIEKYFGDWEPSDSLPQRTFPQETPLTAPVTTEVLGQETPMVALGWRLPAKADPQYLVMTVANQVLANGKCGLFDRNLNNAQQVMQCDAMLDGMTDYSAFWALGYPKEGQTLEQVRDLMMQQVRMLTRGEWDEAVLKAIVNNMKRSRLEDMQSDELRASRFVDAFMAGQTWTDAVAEAQRLDTLSKQTVVDCARRLLTEGYGCVYKRQGEDLSAKKIDKPHISPIETNRDKTSAFVDSVLKMPLEEVKPEFVDFSREVQQGTLIGGNELLTHRDVESQLFHLAFMYERGIKEDPALAVAEQYMPYLGTDSMDASALQEQLYALACDATLSTDDGRTTLTLTGLADNMEEALRLTERWIATAQPDTAIYAQVVNDIVKQHADSKTNQRSCFRALTLYGLYGEHNAIADALNGTQMRQLGAQGVLKHLRDLTEVSQHVLYYGPLKPTQVSRMINDMHPMSEQPVAAHDGQFYSPVVTTDKQVIIAPFQAKNTYMIGYSSRGEAFDREVLPYQNVFNEYFGGGMNSIVFQELRESRGLAYSAGANFAAALRPSDRENFYTHIITQNDKLKDCLTVFDQIVEHMPQSESAFTLARDAVLKRLSTERTLRENILYSFIRCRDRGLTEDPDKEIYERVKTLTLADLMDFHKREIAERNYHLLLLGDEADWDADDLKQRGEIKRVSLDTLFGY